MNEFHLILLDKVRQSEQERSYIVVRKDKKPYFHWYLGKFFEPTNSTQRIEPPTYAKVTVE